MEQPVQRLSAEKILAVWETGRAQHPLDRALTILAAASPGATRAALADMPIGERDARLLDLRTLLLGRRAEGFAECPSCGERVEFPLDTAAFVQPREFAETEQKIEVNGATVRFRFPTSRDLADAAKAETTSQALNRLVARCVLPNEHPPTCHPEPRRRRAVTQPTKSARPGFQTSRIGHGHTDSEPNPPPTDVRSLGALRQPRDDNNRELPAEIVEAISRAMLAADPQAEILLRLSCPACAHEWELLFDIADFLWTEIAALAERLLREIDALARAYGWTEREILALPAQRRQTYLELVAA